MIYSTLQRFLMKTTSCKIHGLLAEKIYTLVQRAGARCRYQSLNLSLVRYKSLITVLCERSKWSVVLLVHVYIGSKWRLTETVPIISGSVQKWRLEITGWVQLRIIHPLSEVYFWFVHDAILWTTLQVTCVMSYNGGVY